MAKAKEVKEAPNAKGVAGALVTHGAFLAACGYYGAATNGFSKAAMHSLYAGSGCGAVLVVCAAMSISGNYKLYMIGVHIALLLQVFFIGLFSWQASKNNVPGKEDRFQLFVVMAVGSVVCLGMMRALKPPKKAKQG